MNFHLRLDLDCYQEWSTLYLTSWSLYDDKLVLMLLLKAGSSELIQCQIGFLRLSPIKNVLRSDHRDLLETAID